MAISNNKTSVQGAPSTAEWLAENNLSKTANTVANTAKSSTVSNLAATSITTDQVRVLAAMKNINWSRSYLWDVELDDVPFPFNKRGPVGLPCTDVDDTLAMGSTYDFEAGTNLLKVPQKKMAYDLRITIYDDEEGTLERFFESWFNQIYHETGVLPIQEAVKLMRVKKLTSSKSIVFDRLYLVYPNATLMGVNRTDSGPRQFSIDFVVARYINPQNFVPTLEPQASSKKNYSMDVQGTIVTQGTITGKQALRE
jgi:hypothetical protein